MPSSQRGEFAFAATSGFLAKGNAHTQFMLLLFNGGHSRNGKYDFAALRDGLFLSRTRPAHTDAH